MAPLSKFALAPTGYTRRIFDDSGAVLIQSICDYCGLQFIGNVSGGLIEDEREHRAACRPPTPNDDGA